MSDSESKILFASRMGISPDSYLPPLDHDRLEPEVIPLSGGSDSERVSRGSLYEEAFSPDSLETLLSSFGIEMNHAKVLMPFSS